jgi:hypothetical protein
MAVQVERAARVFRRCDYVAVLAMVAFSSAEAAEAQRPLWCAQLA